MVTFNFGWTEFNISSTDEKLHHLNIFLGEIPLKSWGF